ncbi:hydroxymethylbilane synthase [Acetobacteraceae bacterium]|nr:hydroxymethylbilane synthase [Acetobacteraceae bacterium]
MTDTLKLAAPHPSNAIDETSPACRHKSSLDYALPLKVGTRASPLALVQTHSFMTSLTRFCPQLREIGAFKEVQVKTSGDRNQKDRLAEIGGKGLFSKEIHESLYKKKIDLAVHSLKDLETHLPEGIVLACTMKREDARDVLILRDRDALRSPENPLSALAEGALVGCASVRRQAQLSAIRPDLRFCLIRGNVQTRLDKVKAGICDATMLAFAGLRRLGMEDRVDIVLNHDFMVPAAGQGIVAITAREKDEELCALLAAVEDPEARAIATAERALLAELDGSCRTPIGGYARILEGSLHLTGLLASEDGSFVLKKSTWGTPSDAERLGKELGEALRRDTPAEIFKAIISD